MNRREEEVYAEAKAKIAEIESKYGLDELLRWLRQAYCTDQMWHDAFRQRRKEFVALVLSWPEVAARPLTVKDAQMLGVCRVCRKPAAAPFILNFGDEHACKTCVEPKPA